MAQRGKRATWAGALALVAGMTAALAPGVAGAASPPRPQERRFDRVASFPVYVNTGDVSEESVAEIVAASVDGCTLVYTDSAQEAVGFVDISVPSHPEAAGLVPSAGSRPRWPCTGRTPSSPSTRAARSPSRAGISPSST